MEPELGLSTAQNVEHGSQKIVFSGSKAPVSTLFLVCYFFCQSDLNMIAGAGKTILSWVIITLLDP